LDDLRKRRESQDEVKRLVARIKDAASKIEDQSLRSTFYLVGEAVEPFVAENYRQCLDLLEKVKGPDQNRFIYAYMRGVCLLRTGQVKEADDWLTVAATLTQARKALMAVNAQGGAKLIQFRASRDASLLEVAIQNFTSVLSQDPDFFAAYFNLACAYAALNDFIEAQNTLKMALEKRPNRFGEIIVAIKEDLGRPSEKLMEEFVRTFLKIQIPPSDPRFPDQLKSALKL
jgi:tetratricopeptide (TPR) repeat protein